MDLRTAAAAALWDLGRDAAGALPRLERLLDNHQRHDAANALGRIGPPGETALPRLRKMLDSGYAWTRGHDAAALWDIAGEAEAAAVVQTLLAAWEENDCTASHLPACLNRMGSAAAPPLPRIRAELALTRRGRSRSLACDEEVQHTCRAVLASRT